MDKAWKSLERKTAKTLGGKRNSRGGDFGQSASDVSHDVFSIEAKYRAKLPRLLRLGLEQAEKYDSAKVPVLVIKEKYQHGALVVMKMKDFRALFGHLPEQSEE